MGEFEAIYRYFTQNQVNRAEVALTLGDDCAITSLPAHCQLAISTDTLVEGTHFLPSISPADLAYKSVAVNLSDLAAMGAEPAWISLALTLPELDESWLAEFSQSLFAILQRYQVSLIGGDTTKGPRSLTLTAQGFVPQGQGLFRHHAKEGDLIFVSGTLGDSAAGLQLLLEKSNFSTHFHRLLLQRHLRPTPRVELGLALRSFSQCAIDISDGLLADLGHILRRSRVGAEIYLENLPLSEPLTTLFEPEQALQFALTGGEDYELCFTLPAEKKAELESLLRSQGIKVSCIGKITANETGLTLFHHQKPVPLPNKKGFDQFN